VVSVPRTNLTKSTVGKLTRKTLNAASGALRSAFQLYLNSKTHEGIDIIPQYIKRAYIYCDNTAYNDIKQVATYLAVNIT